MITPELRIQTGIAIPERRSRGLGLAPLFRQMKFGDSVFIPLSEGIKPGTLSSCCHSASKNAGIRVTIRKVEECSLCGPSCDAHPVSVRVTKDLAQHKPIVGFRIWRVDEPLPKNGKKGPRVK